MTEEQEERAMAQMRRLVAMLHPDVLRCLKRALAEHSLQRVIDSVAEGITIDSTGSAARYRKAYLAHQARVLATAQRRADEQRKKSESS